MRKSLVAGIRSKADARMRSERIWGLRKDQRCWRRKFVRSAGERLDVLVSNAGISKVWNHQRSYRRGFRQSLCHERAQSIFFWSQQLLPVLGERLEHHCDLFSRGPRRSWQARFGQPFDPAYAATKGALENTCKKLGCHSWPAGHTA